MLGTTGMEPGNSVHSREAVLAPLLLAGGLLLTLQPGCGTESTDNPSASELAQVDASSRSVDTLLVLLTVATADGRYLAQGQLETMELWVNEERWGTYGPADSEQSAGGEQEEGWLLVEERASSLIIAQLSQDLSAQTNSAQEQPTTIRDWVELLQRRLAPGDYVAEIRQLVLKDRNGGRLTLLPRYRIPFTIAQGEVVVMVGEVTLEVPELGGAR